MDLVRDESTLLAIRRQVSHDDFFLAQLDQAIVLINKTSRQRFREVFELINVKFQELFPRCFVGGQAHLDQLDTQLEQRQGEPARVAAHWEAAGRRERALPWLRAAAERAHAILPALACRNKR